MLYVTFNLKFIVKFYLTKQWRVARMASLYETLPTSPTTKALNPFAITKA